MKHFKPYGCWLTAILLLVSLGGCGDPAEPASTHPFALYDTTDEAPPVEDYGIVFSSLDVVEQLVRGEDGGLRDNYSVVRLKVLEDGVNRLLTEEEGYLPHVCYLQSHTDTPVEILEVYDAGGGNAPRAGETITVFERWFVKENAAGKKVIVSSVDATPLIRGHEFYAYLYWMGDDAADDDQIAFYNFYMVEMCYPVEPYSTFPEYAGHPILGSDADRLAFAQKYD